MSYIQIRNLWKEYGDQVVLERINTQVKKGDFITIVGASGCGKTTFLKMLLGTETPSRGQILLEAKPIPAEPSEQRGIVFQRYSVFPHMTVLKNVMLARELEHSPLLGTVFGTARRRIQHEATELLQRVGLGHALTKYPHELSGGMQQRLALAQSLIRKPAILLLDEPFGALDPGIRADMHTLVLDLWKQHQLTIFMITHDLKEGFSLGTRLWVFDKLRHDPQAPNAFGARITYDIPVGQADRSLYQKIDRQLETRPTHTEKTEGVLS